MIYGGDMTDQMPIGEIYGSEITVTNAHRWKICGGENWNAHRYLIYGDENLNQMPIDEKSMVVNLKCP